MSKKQILIFILGVFLISLIGCSCNGPLDTVSNEFSDISKDFSLEEKSLILKDKDWYQVYTVSKDKIQQLLDNNLNKYGYSGWEKFSRIEIIGNQNSYVVNGEKNEIKINLKKGSDLYDKIAIFIDQTDNKVILYYGRTYGI